MYAGFPPVSRSRSSGFVALSPHAPDTAVPRGGPEPGTPQVWRDARKVPSDASGARYRSRRGYGGPLRRGVPPGQPAGGPCRRPREAAPPGKSLARNEKRHGRCFRAAVSVGSAGRPGPPDPRARPFLPSRPHSGGGGRCRCATAANGCRRVRRRGGWPREAERRLRARFLNFRKARHNIPAPPGERATARRGRVRTAFAARNLAFGDGRCCAGEAQGGAGNGRVLRTRYEPSLARVNHAGKLPHCRA